MTAETRWRSGPLVVAVVVASLLVALALPYVAPPYWINIATLALIAAILAMGLNLLMGYTGLDSLGQAAFFGLAAYAIGLLTTRYGVGWSLAAPLALLLGTAGAAIAGLVAVRLRGLYFLLVTLAMGQVLWGAMLRWGDVTGGWNGLGGIPAPFEAVRQPWQFYYFALVVFVIASALAYVIVGSPFGLVLKGIRERELRSRTLGYRTYLHKYVAFLLAGFFAASSGILSAGYNRFVSPRDVSLELSFEAMLMVILGGAGTFVGPIIGAIGVTTLRYALSVYIEDYWVIVLGLVYVLVTIFLPRGLVGLIRVLPAIARRPGGEVRIAEQVETEAPPSPDVVREGLTVGGPNGGPVAADGHSPVLQLMNVAKSYGDLQVLNDVDLAVRPGERIGVIGLNGAGKTTLFHVISGVESASGGRIALFGRDRTGAAASERARLGLSRTFQVTMLYPRLTVLENVSVALLGVRYRRHQLVMWRLLPSFDDVRAQAQEILASLGLWQYRDVESRHLSYGHQRQLEIALALASQPSVLLLDEPTAGLSQVEIADMIRLLRSLPRELTVLVVEHHLEVIFELVERVLVLHEGRVIADDTPEAVTTNAEIQRLYLGTSRTARAVSAAPSIAAGHGTERSLLSLREVDAYYGDSHVLHGVSLEVARSQAVVLMGRNGVGKTTTVRSVIGLTPPRRGSVRFRGRELVGLPSHEIAKRGIALVPQGRRVFGSLTVKEHLEAAGRRKKTNGAWPNERILEIFPPLRARFTQKAAHLSGGEQSMLAVARALRTEPECLLLDEPTEGLAPRYVEIVLEVIERLKREGELAILLVMPELPLALGLADHIYVMSKGRIVFAGPPVELERREDVQAKYIGVGP